MAVCTMLCALLQAKKWCCHHPGQRADRIQGGDGIKWRLRLDWEKTSAKVPAHVWVRYRIFG